MTPEQARFGILGLLVGDALGVPYEFTPAKDIPPSKEIDYLPPEGFEVAHRGVPAGTWSDDGAQALCVLKALLEGSGSKGFADHLVAWRDQGFMAVDGRVFDCGITTNMAIQNLKNGVPYYQSGIPDGEGNGALMRTLPVAFLVKDANDIVKQAMYYSQVTHASVMSLICCAQYALWAKYLAEGLADAWDVASDLLHEALPEGIVTAFVMHIKHPRKTVTGSGHVVDSLHSAKYAVDNGHDFESTVKLAIQLGEDTDTTAAIAGGIAGIIYQDIPDRWLQGLRGRQLLNPLLEELKLCLS